MAANDELTVLMIAPFPFPSDRGSPIRAKNFALLANESVNVHVCTYHLGTDDEISIPIHRIPDIPIKFREAGASYKKAICDVFLVAKAVRLIRRYDVDIVHGHLHEGCLTGVVSSLTQLDNVPVIYDAHGTLVEEMIETGFFDEDSLQYPFWRLVEDRIQRSADHVIAQSKPRRNALIKAGISASDISVVPDFVDTKLFRPQSSDLDLANQLDLDPQSPVVGYTGTIQDYQGISELLRAFVSVRAEIPDAKLLLVGGGDIEQYHQYAENIGLGDAVVFAGAQPFEEMPAYLSLVDVAAGPRRYGKNLPSKLLTYMSTATATVSTDIEGVSDLFNDGENGVVVPKSDIDKLADALVGLLVEDERRERIATAGRQTVVESYSRRACVDRLASIYHKLVS